MVWTEREIYKQNLLKLNSNLHNPPVHPCLPLRLQELLISLFQFGKGLQIPSGHFLKWPSRDWFLQLPPSPFHYLPLFSPSAPVSLTQCKDGCSCLDPCPCPLSFSLLCVHSCFFPSLSCTLHWNARCHIPVSLFTITEFLFIKRLNRHKERWSQREREGHSGEW